MKWSFIISALWAILSLLLLALKYYKKDSIALAAERMTTQSPQLVWSFFWLLADEKARFSEKWLQGNFFNLTHLREVRIPDPVAIPQINKDRSLERSQTVSTSREGKKEQEYATIVSSIPTDVVCKLLSFSHWCTEHHCSVGLAYSSSP